MTMPHLMNCPHSEDGWCLSCVEELHNSATTWEDRTRSLLSLGPPKQDTWSQSMWAEVWSDVEAGRPQTKTKSQTTSIAPANTVSIKLAVAVAKDGSWNAIGWYDANGQPRPFSDFRSSAVEGLPPHVPDGEYHVIEVTADVPLPICATPVQGTVSSIDI